MVPYEGDRRVCVELLGGHIDFGVSSFPSAISHVKAGSFRWLVIGGPGKVLFPEVPSTEELGYKVPFKAGFGLIAPKGTPPHIIKKLHDFFKKAMEDPRYEAVCKNLYCFNTYASGEDYFNDIKEKYAITGEVLKELGLLKGK
jgi:tripartite-type tricarboxylate transporter receptor subunit TctC